MLTNVAEHLSHKKGKDSFSQHSHIAANTSTKEAGGMYSLGVKTIVNLHTAYGQGHCTVTPGILCKQRNA